jgi:chorismate synthase
MSAIRYLTAGESHGQALTAIVEGVPAGLQLTEQLIREDLARRQRGYGRGGRMQIETDYAEIMSGVRRGITMGSPIGLLIRNRDWDNWKDVMAVEPRDDDPKRVTRLRPGHADLPGVLKYRTGDVRPILERASARETTARVAVGAIARQLLALFGVYVASHVTSLGGVTADPAAWDWERIEAAVLRCADAAAERLMVERIDRAREDGDSLGGTFEVVAWGLPIGLGSHVQWDRKLDAQLAAAVLSIQSVKGVEIGPAFENAARPGSQVMDQITYDPATSWGRRSNRMGGIEGGMTTGQPVLVRAAVKPISTLRKPLPSIDFATREESLAHYERADTTVVPAAGVVGEAVVAITLANAMLDKFGGDHVEETLANYRAYVATYAPAGATVTAPAGLDPE